ncbi:MAG: 2-hydroxyhexa-2,4-dienoate hydratase [Pseudomonadota bacterium]
MFDSAQIAQLAAELQQSQKTRQQVEHFSKRFPGMSIEDGYRVSRAWVALQLAEGRKVIGHKIGLTSRAMQQASQIDEPDYGTLLDNMLYTCTPGHVLSIAHTDFVVPRVEVELAFVLKKDLQGPDVTVDQVLAATDYVTPAIEIIDSRIEQFDRHTKVMRKVFDTISDNAAHCDGCRKSQSTHNQFAMVRRYFEIEWRGRRDGFGGRCSRPSCGGHCMACQQVGPMGRAFESRTNCVGRLLYQTSSSQSGRCVRCRLRPTWPFAISIHLRKRHDENTRESLQESHH